MMMLPTGITNMTKYDDFAENDKKEMMEIIEKIWSRLKKIIVIICKNL